MIFKQWLNYSLRFLGLLILALPISVIGQSVSHSQLNFNLAPTFVTGADTYDTTFADLDADGNLDAIVGNNSNQTILTILYGNGDGSFSNPVIIPLYGFFAVTIAAGDLNNDGRPDITFASFHNRVATLLNQGNRQFSAPVYSIPPDPPNGLGEFVELALGDFDGDGKQDVVALQDQSSKRLRFFHFSGQGTLTVFATLDLIGNPDNTEGTMFVGDLNGDNRTDVIVASGGSSNVPRNISFVFGRTDTNLSFTFGFNVENEAYGLSVKDLDNDGDNDLAVAFRDRFGDITHSLQPFANNGNGTFTPGPPIKLSYLLAPSDITTGDFNNDGKIDLAAVIFQDAIMVTYGDGNLTYSGTEYYAISPSGKIYSGDLNHDNKIDLFTASGFIIDYNRITVVLNDNFHGFKAPRAVLGSGTLMDAADFNNDGYPDLVSARRTEYSASSVDIMLNDYGDGGVFLSEVSYDSPIALSSVKTGDFNGDGKADVVSSHDNNARRLAVYLGNGTGSVAAPVSTTFSEGIRNAFVFDLNFDGKDDVFAVDGLSRGYAMISNGNGTFSAAPGSPFTVPNSQLQFQSGDFNRDTNLDLICSTGIFLGNGKGQFVLSPVSLPVNSFHIVVSDFNRDGNIDIAGAGDGSLKGIFGDGKGGVLGIFSQPFRGDITSIQSMVVTDFDLDSYPDVALVMNQDDPHGLNEWGNLVIIPSGGSKPSWKTPIHYSVGNASLSLKAADFNLDGKPDIGYLGHFTRGVIYNTTARTNSPKFDFDGDGKSDVSVFRPASGVWHLQRSQSGYAAVGFGLPTDKLVPADYDGDGKTDLAVFRENPADPGKAKFYILQSSTNQFREEQFGASGDTPVAGDWDGDGKADIGVYRSGTESNPQGYFYYRPSSQPTVNFIPYPWGIAGDKPVVADYDGDGKSDPAVFRQSDGAWYIQQSRDGFYAIKFGATEDKPVVGDYDGDGKADPAVYRPSNGVWYLWRSKDGFAAAAFGISTDKPVPADYDGDGKTDYAVYRDGNWFILNSTSGFAALGFGLQTDKPIPNSFVP